MRLIDADVLKKAKCKRCIDKRCGDGYVCGDINLIDNVPTAYDVDKVMNELLQNSEQIDEFEEYTPQKLTLITRRVVDLSKAIDIVKEGGVDEGN